MSCYVFLRPLESYNLNLPEDAEGDPDLTTPLFRIFQEALTNVPKHAKATGVKASFKRTRSSIILEITDNGIGITQEDL
jgi:two-component system sensor histidine kinase UhpB